MVPAYLTGEKENSVFPLSFKVHFIPRRYYGLGFFFGGGTILTLQIRMRISLQFLPSALPKVSRSTGWPRWKRRTSRAGWRRTRHKWPLGENIFTLWMKEKNLYYLSCGEGTFFPHVDLICTNLHY